MAKKQGYIPKHELEALADVLYPTLKAFYDNPEGQAQFKEWQEQQKPSAGKKSETTA